MQTFNLFNLHLSTSQHISWHVYALLLLILLLCLYYTIMPKLCQHNQVICVDCNYPSGCIKHNKLVSHEFQCIKSLAHMRSHSSCTGWGNGCNLLAYMIFSYLWWGHIYFCTTKFYYTRVTVDRDKLCCVPWQIIKPAVCFLLRLAPRWHESSD